MHGWHSSVGLRKEKFIAACMHITKTSTNKTKTTDDEGLQFLVHYNVHGSNINNFRIESTLGSWTLGVIKYLR